jgi:hypothetical protein
MLNYIDFPLKWKPLLVLPQLGSDQNRLHYFYVKRSTEMELCEWLAHSSRAYKTRTSLSMFTEHLKFGISGRIWTLICDLRTIMLFQLSYRDILKLAPSRGTAPRLWWLTAIRLTLCQPTRIFEIGRPARYCPVFSRVKTYCITINASSPFRNWCWRRGIGPNSDQSGVRPPFVLLLLSSTFEIGSPGTDCTYDPVINNHAPKAWLQGNFVFWNWSERKDLHLLILTYRVSP